MIFYLGAPEAVWLERSPVPLFVSRNRLLRLVDRFPRARVPWAMDSGGFTEVTACGGWRVSARDFAREVSFFAQEIGGLAWAAPMDWMCEDAALAKTGKTVAEHQRLTLANFLELRTIAPWHTFVPVLQGRTRADYLRHADAYEAAGFDLARERLVGVGSVCRRQSGGEAAAILRDLAARGLKLHGFGLSTLGLRQACDAVVSADSMAWSRAAREEDAAAARAAWPAGAGPRRGAAWEAHAARHRTGRANTLAWALAWRRRMLASLPPACAPDEARSRAEARRLAAYADRFPSDRPPKRRGELPQRELDRLVAAAARVLWINAALQDAEDVEDDRAAYLGDVPAPLTHRAVLTPEDRAAIGRLTARERARLGGHAATLAEAMAATDPGPLVVDLAAACAAETRAGPAPCARPVVAPRSGRAYCPERCARADAARLLARRAAEKRAGAAMRTTAYGGGACTLADAPYVLARGAGPTP